ncbi:type II secretion system protein, partial [bacterium]|nr:type II secretion system protein [bacterium]
MKKRETAFTLAEGATHVENCNDCRKTAFTLAEVLITLGIIGVVAAVALPALITNINDRANSERQANIAQKITQAMEQMRAHGELVQYGSTDAFVDVLQKYLKITKRCDADHLADCWTTSTITGTDGATYNIADFKTRKKLLKNSATDGNNVGLILADGASMILTYNPSAQGIDIGDKVLASNKYLPISSSKYKDFPYTTSVTGAIDFVMDVNGKKGPNMETVSKRPRDIRSFRLAGFTKKLPCENGSKGCVAYVGTSYSAVNCSTSAASEDETTDYAKYCGPTPSGYSNDRWAGAKKVCDEAGMYLPEHTELKQILDSKSEYSQIASVTINFWTSNEYPTSSQLLGRIVRSDEG